MVRQLLDADLTTSTIAIILPCLARHAGAMTTLCSDVIEALQQEQARIDAGIQQLSASSAALGRVIEESLSADPR